MSHDELPEAPQLCTQKEEHYMYDGCTALQRRYLSERSNNYPIQNIRLLFEDASSSVCICTIHVYCLSIRMISLNPFLLSASLLFCKLELFLLLRILLYLSCVSAINFPIGHL